MINAASPIEAYDSSQEMGIDNTVMQPRMTETRWSEYSPHLYASNWHELFDDSDARSELTWKNLFGQKVPALAYNFYSTGEDVVENPDHFEHFVHNVADAGGVVRHAWVQNEIGKGNVIARQVALGQTNTGWRFHVDFPNRYNPGQGYYITTNAFLNSHRKYTPDEASAIPEEELKTKPFFWPFTNSTLLDTSNGSDEAAKVLVRYETLASAIPAQSYAGAANKIEVIDRVGNKNMDMMNLKNGGWPRTGGSTGVGDWVHSDFRDVAFSCVLPMYQEMIDLGKLDE